MDKIKQLKQAALFIAVAICAILAVSLLTGCNDRYRYPCQNPDNFYKPDCQKPKCQFTQQCPEYLVAPILEKQIDQTKPANTEANR